MALGRAAGRQLTATGAATATRQHQHPNILCTAEVLRHGRCWLAAGLLWPINDKILGLVTPRPPLPPRSTTMNEPASPQNGAGMRGPCPNVKRRHSRELQARIRDVEEVNREDARGLYEASAETVVPMPGENEPGESNLGDPRLDEARSEVSGVPGEALEVPGEQEVPEERVATPDELKPQEQGK